jgi:hypothetical protein
VSGAKKVRKIAYLIPTFPGLADYAGCQNDHPALSYLRDICQLSTTQDDCRQFKQIQSMNQRSGLAEKAYFLQKSNIWAFWADRLGR